MIQTLALIGIIILFIISSYFNKKNAQKRCVELSLQINNRKNFYDIAKNKSLDGNNDFVKNKEKIYLITKEKTSIKMYNFNGDKAQTILDSQYQKIQAKLNIKNPSYTYSFNYYSIFYRFPSPYEHSILRVDVENSVLRNA